MSVRSAARELRRIFEDLTGQASPLDKDVPAAAVKLLGSSAAGLGYSQFNELLLYLGYDRVTHAFFQYLVGGSTAYRSGASIKSVAHFRSRTNEFRKLALLFAGNVKYAFKNLSRDRELLEDELSRLRPRTGKSFRDRHAQVLPPVPIPGSDTYYLGYIVAAEIDKKLRENKTDRVAIAEKKKREEVVDIGKRNHNAYLVSDHLDVYVATSMRERHEYAMVYKTTRAIFGHRDLRNLNLRYFDPTQAYCDDRVDKGLAEALMLKRARCTIYFAQESDTLGKDSELASTLAQGKPVIAFVPRPEANHAKRLVAELRRTATGTDMRHLVLTQLRFIEPSAAWHDETVRKWIRDPSAFDEAAGISRLQIAIEKHYKSRDKTLREVHPLGIQVNLSTGVANGVLVANTIDECAALVRRIVTNTLEFDVDSKVVDSGHRYLYLREKVSQCIFRVATGDVMLTNAFWNFYLGPSE